MRFYLPILLLVSIFSIRLSAQEGCPGCEITLPELAEDTIFISALPDGSAGAYYEADISFRLPKSTTPVAEADSTVLAGLPINSIVIKNLNDLPTGLNWEANQLEFETSEQTDGCAKICGTPQVPGLYMIEVLLEAEVIILKQETSFFIPLFIAPSTSENEGFTMENDIGCGQTFVSFTNNIPSDGREGFSYFWDFGNGEVSTDENPTKQFYSMPGEYYVNYLATVDTSDFQLVSVTVREGDCSDLIGLPDYYISVIDPTGEEIFLATHRDNEPLPITFEVNIPIGEGEYTLQVTDEDRGLEGSDDRCAEIPFTVSDTLLIKDGVEAFLEFGKPIDTIQSVDTVLVLPFPAAPKVARVINPPICNGDTVQLTTTTYEDFLQWSKDGMAITGETAQTLMVTETGEYNVSYTSPTGCTVVSAANQVNFEATPPTPVFENTDNFLSLVNFEDSTADLSYQWLLNDEMLAMETSTSLCAAASGVYTLQVVDERTACSATFELEVELDETVFNCNLSSVESLTLDYLNIYPNPFTDQLTIELSATTSSTLELAIIDLFGRTRHQQRLYTAGKSNIDLPNLENGVYFVKIFEGNRVLTRQLVKQ